MRPARTLYSCKNSRHGIFVFCKVTFFDVPALLKLLFLNPMKVFHNIFTAAYRAWFYLLTTLTTVVLFPFLAVSVLKTSWYPFFFKIARLWSAVILYGMGFIPVIKKQFRPNPKHSYMFVANHTSMTDIMLMFYSSKNPFVFVGKKELAKLPFFGYIYKKTCILVDRSDNRSRIQAIRLAEKRLKNGLSICIFPEGGVPKNMNLILDEFKDGAFRLAIEFQIPVVPITFHDNKKRFPYALKGSPGKKIGRASCRERV